MEEGGTYVERRSRSKFLRIFHFHSPTPNLNPQSGNHVSQPPFPFGCFNEISSYLGFVGSQPHTLLLHCDR